MFFTSFITLLIYYTTASSLFRDVVTYDQKVVIWEACTPYFEKRNIHFYVNKCGFQIDQFWCEYFQPDHPMPDTDERDPDEGPDEMLRFIKVMKP